MSKHPPYYLQNFTQSESNHPDFSDEKVYRRSKKTEPATIFEDLSRNDLLNGISVNRSKLSGKPEDVLWLGEEERDEQGNYKFEYKEGFNVFEADYVELQNSIWFRFAVQYAPLVHNVAHCNIICLETETFSELTNKERKEALRNIKAGLASLFRLVSDQSQ